MNHLHEMLVEDEILLCGLVTVLGFLAGAAAHLAGQLGVHQVVEAALIASD